MGEIPDDIIEPGFYWICKIIGALGLHYSFFFGFFCCLQVFFIILAFKNKPELLPWIFYCSTFLSIYGYDDIGTSNDVCLLFFIWLVSRINFISFAKYAIWIVYVRSSFINQR